MLHELNSVLAVRRVERQKKVKRKRVKRSSNSVYQEKQLLLPDTALSTIQNKAVDDQLTTLDSLLPQISDNNDSGPIKVDVSGAIDCEKTDSGSNKAGMGLRPQWSGNEAVAGYRSCSQLETDICTVHETEVTDDTANQLLLQRSLVDDEFKKAPTFGVNLIALAAASRAHNNKEEEYFEDSD